MRKEAIVILVMIGVVLCLIVIVTGGIIVKSVIREIPKENKTIHLGSEINYTIEKKEDMPFCGDEMMFFKTGPISMNDCSYITPLGEVNPPTKVFSSERLKYHIEREINNSQFTRSVNIISPGHAWITKVAKITGPSGTSYSINLKPCQDLTFILEKVLFLNEDIFGDSVNIGNCSKYVTGGYEYEVCEKEIFVEVGEGQVLGRIGGSTGDSFLGLTAYDKRIKEIDITNEYRFNFNEFGAPTCPLYYFVFESRASMEKKLGEMNNGTFYRRVEFPFCGEIYQDLPTTLQGFWFLNGVKGSHPEDPHVALVHDNVNPGIGVFSIGSSFEKIEAGKYTFEPESKSGINPDFKITKQGVTYCYQLADKKNRQFVILVQLVDDNNMRMEIQDSNVCKPQSQLTANALSFSR